MNITPDTQLCRDESMLVLREIRIDPEVFPALKR